MKKSLDVIIVEISWKLVCVSVLIVAIEISANAVFLMQQQVDDYLLDLKHNFKL
jgi:hypothetical protein